MKLEHHRCRPRAASADVVDAGTTAITMTLLPRCLARLRYRLGWLGISLLMVPVFAWVWPAAKEPFKSVFNGSVPGYVLSGRLFSDRFDVAHAGFAMDQPTIGKWLFWFTFMAASSLPYAAAVGWLANRKTVTGRFAFGISASVLGVLLLSMLSWPLCWLVQYVCSMGFTPKRFYGLMYAVGGSSLVIGFIVWAFWNPNRKNASPGPRENGHWTTAR
jgi:hypothetical protein